MLDPDEMAAYEAWKQHKLTSSVDLSVSAFNLEMEGPALAYEAGLRAALGRGPGETLDDLIAASPYRRKGMTGYVPPKEVEE